MLPSLDVNLLALAQLPKPAPENKEVYQQILELWKTFDSGQVEKAFERIRELKEKFPDSIDLSHNEGLLYIQRAQKEKNLVYYSQAIKIFDALIASDSKNILAHYYRAKAYLGVGKKEDAENDLHVGLDKIDKSILENKENPKRLAELYFYQALISKLAGKDLDAEKSLLDAEKIYKELIKIEVDKGEPRKNDELQGLTRSQIKFYYDLNKAYVVKNPFAKLFPLYKKIIDQTGDKENVQDAESRVVKLIPVAEKYADLFLKNNDFDNAKIIYSLLIEVRPKVAEYYDNRFYLNLSLSSFNEAIADFEWLKNNAPKFVDDEKKIGVAQIKACYVREKEFYNPKEALKLAEEVISNYSVHDGARNVIVIKPLDQATRCLRILAICHAANDQWEEANYFIDIAIKRSRVESEHLKHLKGLFMNKRAFELTIDLSDLTDSDARTT